MHKVGILLGSAGLRCKVSDTSVATHPTAKRTFHRVSRPYLPPGFGSLIPLQIKGSLHRDLEQMSENENVFDIYDVCHKEQGR